MQTLNVSTKRIVHWMNVIREEKESNKYRLLENFWESQINSKVWLINTVKRIFPDIKRNAYVFGGWYGILSQFIVDNLDVETVYSIDKDNYCEIIGPKLSGNEKRIVFLTSEMEHFNDYVDVELIINTSTEHLNQITYDTWFDNLPKNVPIIVQGNNFFSCKEHVRCYETLEEFNDNNRLKDIIFTDVLDCIQFKRFMTIGYKR